MILYFFIKNVIINFNIFINNKNFLLICYVLLNDKLLESKKIFKGKGVKQKFNLEFYIKNKYNSKKKI